MKRITLFTMLSVVVLLVALGWLVMADEEGRSKGEDGYQSIGEEGELEYSFAKQLTKTKRSLERVGATETQIEEAMKLLESTATVQEQRYAKQKELQQQIQNEYNDTTPDRAELKLLIKEATDLQAEIRFTALTTALDMRNIVGNEIWQKVTHGHGYHRRHERGEKSDKKEGDRKSRNKRDRS